MPTRTAIACFGEALIDFLARPSASADAPRQFVEYAGGAPANVAAGVARLGGEARFIGMLGTDMFGDFLMSEFTRYGVDTTHVRRTGAARTALAFVSLDADGERSFEFYRPPAADLLFGSSDFAPRAFDDIAIFHACSNSLTEAGIAEVTVHGMQRAADAGALVSMDLNLRPALWPPASDPGPIVRRALQNAHLVKLSGEEAAFLADGAREEEAFASLFEGAARAIVVTDGPAPIRWWTRELQGEAPTFAVAAIDTTAAGDAFVAGLLQALSARGVGPDALEAVFSDHEARSRILRQAAAAGALATTRHGAFAAMPSLSEVNALLEAHA